MLLPALLVALPSCSEMDQTQAPETTTKDASTTATMAPLVGMDAVTSRPSEWDGKQIILAGEVNRIFGPQTFSIGGPDFGGELLIAAEKDIPSVPKRRPDKYVMTDDIAAASGTVRKLAASDVKKVFGTDAKEETYQEFLGKPYLDATAVAITPRMAEGAQALPGATGSTAEPITDMTALLSAASTDPQSLVGRRVELANTTIQKVAHEQTFWVGPNERQMMLVRLDQAPPSNGTIAKGKPVTIAGEIQKAPSVQQAKTQWKLDTQDADMLARQQIYVHAQKATPSSGR